MSLLPSPPLTPFAARVLPALLCQQCPGCGQPRVGACDLCRSLVRHLPVGDAPPGVWAARRYEGVMCDLVVGMKYRNRPQVAAWLAELFDELRESLSDVDVVTWAPTSLRRRRGRGFDQAEVLARAVGRRWRVPVRGLLVRDDAPSQTGRSRHERLVGPGFRAQSPRRWRHVVVIDDVVTTGATLGSAVQALHRAGGDRVSAAALAAAPLPASLVSPGRPVPTVPGR